MILTNVHLGKELDHLTTTPRYRLYSMCLVITLSFLVIASVNHETDGWVRIYLPLAAASLLVICLAGAEYHLYTERLAHERAEQVDQRARAEHDNVERQRAFNRIWQELVDARGEERAPLSVAEELAELFHADLTTIWVADESGSGFHLRGAHATGPLDRERLDKIGQVAPCFDALRESGRQIAIADFRAQTAPALAWFCEDQGLCRAVFSPVLVRRELVGVLAVFYKEPPELTAKQIEEMQSAANLLLLTV